MPLGAREKSPDMVGGRDRFALRPSDGSHLAEKGKTAAAKGTGQRFGCNIISATTNRGDLPFMVFGECFTVTVFLEFLERLIRQQTGLEAFLIVGRHAVHKAKKAAK